MPLPGLFQFMLRACESGSQKIQLDMNKINIDTEMANK
jgi:hypothetical protein